ncbi:MAG: zinc ribbon domain-containing protein [Bacillaceae bacterium]|nr:zinc ribbon domain-containing protein [Bacillaceae bacterium]
MICGDCGGAYGRKVWNSNDERFRRRVWRCNKRYVKKGKKGCDNTHINDEVLYQIFINVFNTILENKDFFTQKWREKLSGENLLEKYKAKQFIEIITKSKPITQFDANLFFAITEKMTVLKEGMLIVTLLDGTEIECKFDK